MTFSNPLIREIVEMHTYCRPHGTWGDLEFRRRYVLPLLDLDYVDGFEDAHRNIHVYVGDEDPRVIFSCHTDTVHKRTGKQRVHLSADGILRVAKKDKKRSGCLGADDTAGVFLCRQLILSRVPGHYIFHYGEERGCIGSRAIAEDAPYLLGDASIAIAFDRSGYGDVITHQCGSRTSSDLFALSLSEQLNRGGFSYRPDDGGVFTDTNEYKDLIPECTNVSVGYFGAHTPEERLDVPHVLRLLETLRTMDQGALVVDRDPTVPDPDEVRDRLARYTFLGHPRDERGAVVIDWSNYKWDEDEDERDEDADQLCAEMDPDWDPTLPIPAIRRTRRGIYLDPQRAEILRLLGGTADEDEDDPRYS